DLAVLPESPEPITPQFLHDDLTSPIACCGWLVRMNISYPRSPNWVSFYGTVHWRKLFQWVLVVEVLMATQSDLASSASDVGAVSVSADEFLSSLGVDIHVDQGVSGSSY